MTAFATALAAASATALAAWLARRRYLLVTVRGDSMAPTYVDGQRLLVRRGLAPRPSDVVVFRTPASVAGGPEGLKWLVKRVAACAGQPVPPEVRDRVAAGPAATIPEGCLVVRGDNPVSQDSRHFGYVLSSSVVGVALAEKKRKLHPYHINNVTPIVESATPTAERFARRRAKRGGPLERLSLGRGTAVVRNPSSL